MERILRDRLQPLELYEYVDINKKYKFPCKSALYIIDQFEEHLQHPTDLPYVVLNNKLGYLKNSLWRQQWKCISKDNELN